MCNKLIIIGRKVKGTEFVGIVLNLIKYHTYYLLYKNKENIIFVDLFVTIYFYFFLL